MHSPDPRPSLPARFVVLRSTALLLALGCLTAACDRHSAAEVSEGYGHGSSHRKSYSDHQIDSRDHSASFSDTQGLEAGKEQGEAPAAAAATPSPSPSAAASKFFQQ